MQKVKYVFILKHGQIPIIEQYCAKVIPQTFVQILCKSLNGTSRRFEHFLLEQRAIYPELLLPHDNLRYFISQDAKFH